jgi:biopolymer transport protein ExbD
MQIQDDNAPYDQVNITPMVDLVFVLLVIFILMCTASVQGVKVNLPKASAAAPSLAKPKTKAITINHEGGILLDTLPMSNLQDLEQHLTQAKAEVPDLPVVIRSDGMNQYQCVMDVLDVVGRLGITQVGLATSKPGAK